MSQPRYTVLWIPTLFHKHLTPFIEKKSPFDADMPFEIDAPFKIDEDINQDNVEISDGVDDFCYLDLTLKKPTDEKKPTKRDIWINVRIVKRKSEDEPAQERRFWVGDRKTEAILKLECTEASRNGLIEYSYQIPENFDPETQTHPLIDKQEGITHAVYHAIKDFFHEHKFHEDSKDSIVDPYPSEVKVDIKSENNLALYHYLEQFEDRLLIAIEGISARANIITELRNLSNGDGLNEALEETQKLLEECNKALGFGVYYRSLYSSKYNLSFKKRCKSKDTEKDKKEEKVVCELENDNPVENEECTCESKNPDCKRSREYYQCAINIETSLNYIKVIRNQHRDFFSTASSLTHLDNQKKLARSQKQFLILQREMGSSIAKIKGIQSEASSQLGRVETAIGDLDDILAVSEDVSKTRNRWNVFFALLSIGLGVIGAISLFISPSQKDIDKIVKENIIKQTDSIIDARNENLLKSIKDLQSQPETETEPETENQKPG